MWNLAEYLEIRQVVTFSRRASIVPVIGGAQKLYPDIVIPPEIKIEPPVKKRKIPPKKKQKKRKLPASETQQKKRQKQTMKNEPE